MAFVPVRTSTIRGNQEINFDIYILINKKYIHYIRRSDEFEEERLTRLKEKRVKRLYINPEDEPNYRLYLENNLKRVMEKDSSLDQRADILQGAATAAIEDTFDNPQDLSRIDSLKTMMDTQIDFLADNKFALSSLLKLENYDFDVYLHSLNVASLAVGLGMKVLKKQADILEILSMGGVLHDIGKTQLNLDPTIPPEKLSPEEFQEFKKHPELGAQLLANNNTIPGKVKEIIYCHEELITGEGYPRGLKKQEIDILSQIVCLVNIYDRFITFNKLSPKETWKNITLDNVGVHDLKLINALKELLNEQGLL